MGTVWQIGIDTRLSHRGKIHPKKSTPNKKVHLNKFFRTISVGLLSRVKREEGKSSRELLEHFRVNAVFFWYF